MATSLDLNDFQRVKAVLAAEVERAGRKSDLVDLLKAAHRVQQLAGVLLRQAGHD
jgi:hypothetical protein